MQHRVADGGCDFAKWNEDEGPLVQPRMRNPKIGLVQATISEQQEVEVERPGGPARDPLADTTRTGLELQQRLEQLTR